MAVFFQDPTNRIVDGGPLVLLACPVFCHSFTRQSDVWRANDIQHGAFGALDLAEVLHPNDDWTGAGGTVLEVDPAAHAIGQHLGDVSRHPDDTCASEVFIPLAAQVSWSSSIPTVRMDEPWFMRVRGRPANQGHIGITEGDDGGGGCGGFGSLRVQSIAGTNSLLVARHSFLCTQGGVVALEPQISVVWAIAPCITATLSVDPCGHRSCYSIALDRPRDANHFISYADADGNPREATAVSYEMTRTSARTLDDTGFQSDWPGRLGHMQTMQSWSDTQRLSLSVSGAYVLGGGEVGEGYVCDP